MLHSFDNFEVDSDKFELRQNGVVRRVEPLVFDLILFFVRNAGRVVARDEIIDQVWNGRVVSDATVSSCIKSARKALGDSGDIQNFIRTVRGRGFQFVADVSGCETRAPDASTFQQSKRSSRSLPSLVVQPFLVADGSIEPDTIADRLTQSLTTTLTRIPLLFVASNAALKEETLQPQEIRDALNVDYVVEGSVRKSGGSISVHVQLLETRNGFHLWAQQFEKNHGQDTLTGLLQDIISRLEPQVTRAIFNELRSEDGDLSAHQLLLQAMGLLSLKGWHSDTFREAARLLQKSIELEPGLALTHAYLSLILALGHRVGLLRDDDTIVSQALQEADVALELDNMDSNVVGLAGCAIADAGQPDRAIPLLNNAVALNPNNAQAWAALGSAYLILGDHKHAIKHLSQGVKISPIDSRLAVWGALLSLAYLQSGQHDRARSEAETACERSEKTYLPRLSLAAIEFSRCEIVNAQKALRECCRVKPDLSREEINSFLGRKLGASLWELRSKIAK